ncbi:nuclear transport factor 2 family protein [Streptomyces peucetius]|uniref:Nuclear transport factor 2 family protein n=1 Tax=Streptomyces peucetius TaxID=1950 RepID=A0ABY6I399_STRPE|nr:nuclear transport factor 2 family protein [Streptomyces peucetius]UYQ61451.1 nuclear transport factor 2 family protein [Streptomyces peucetius]
MTTQTDHTEIALLVSRFFRALDERKFAPGWADGYVTDDVRMVAPVGVYEGPAAVRGTEEAIGRFARTQHMSSDLLTDIDEASGTAHASWNALMVHVHHEDPDPLFTVGGRYDTELRRTDEGWRISRMSVEAVWTTGRPPVLPSA